MSLPEHNEELTRLRELSKEHLQECYDRCIPTERQLPGSFWASYTEEQVLIGLRACLLLWTASSGRLVPREFQLQTTIALLSGQDCLVDVGTGYGKTVCMILPCLLKPKKISMIVSPLKRLQAVQVVEFERYGIKAIAINEDTPGDADLWKDISQGVYTAVLVQPEQLFMYQGHMTRLARMIRKDREFTKKIRFFSIDEAHFIHGAGMEHYGLPAFRPAWARLGEVRIKLPNKVRVQALSGTQPEHIKKTIIKSLLFDESNLLSIKLSSNRPNMSYATHPIVGDLTDFRNLDFLVPKPYPPGYVIPKTLVFHDSISGATGAMLHTLFRLPKELQNQGIVKHYHSLMSKEYLTQTYDEFKEESSKCRILHATEGASTGLDIPDIDVVVQYGIPREVPTTLQRGGRGGRNPLKEALFLIMYEPWVLLIDLDEEKIDFKLDPDHPNVAKLTIHSTKRDRTGGAIIKIVRRYNICIRLFFAQYLGDNSPEAVLFTTKYGCCDRHPNTDFHIRDFFRGRFLYLHGCDMFYGDVDEVDRQKIVPPPKPKRKASPKTRDTKDRKELVARIHKWRHVASENDPLAVVRPMSFIIDDKSILALARAHPNDVTTTDHITTILNETAEWKDEWATSLLKIIEAYNAEINTARELEDARQEARRKQAKKDDLRLAFEAETAANEERVRQQVIQRFHATGARSSVLQPLTQNIPSTSSVATQSPAPTSVGLRRSVRKARQAQIKK